MNSQGSPHPTDLTLISFGLGRLDDDSADAVGRHLEACDDCRRRVAQVSADPFLDRIRQASRPLAREVNRTGTFDVASDSDRSDRLAPDELPLGLADHPDYEVVRELGRGGMGVVYLVRNRLLGRSEVLKIMASHLTERPAVLDRFLREMRAVARLHHPNIVTAYSASRIGDSIGFAMEYVDGLDLSKMVKLKGPLPVSLACNFIHQAALGLQHALEEGLVHRDIKPGNLMLSRRRDRPVVKVCDFGLAKLTREEQFEGRLTFEGQALGTPDFIAPEQILNAPDVDIRADIYSLGGTLFYLLAGRPPFLAASLYDMYQAHMSRNIEPINLLRPEVPAELASLVAKMMAKQPARRFATPLEVAEALRPFFKKSGTTSNGPGQSVSVAAEPAPARPNPNPRPPAPAALNPGPSVPTAEPDPEFEQVQPADGAIAAEPLSDQPRSHEPRSLPAPVPLPRRQTRVRLLAAAGLLLAGLVGWWAWGVLGSVRVKTSEGVIVLSDVPPDADVFIDGDKITLTWPGEGKSLEIRAVAGERKLEVKQAGVSIYERELIVKAGESQAITVRLEPAAGGSASSGAGSTLPTFTNTLGMTFRLIPAGEFDMGITESQLDWVRRNVKTVTHEMNSEDEFPQHHVRITRPFYLGATEVTVAHFRRFVRTSGYQTEAERDGRGSVGWAGNGFERSTKYNWKMVGFPQTPEHPVVCVSRADARAFCVWLSQKEGRKYRLPTEAEWEYACRAGTKTLFTTGPMPRRVWTIANTSGASDDYDFTAPAGQFPANSFGLYDMIGNAWEWCDDNYNPNFYKNSPVDDPVFRGGPPHGVWRGGAWNFGAAECRPTNRYHELRGEPSISSCGFRVACDSTNPTP